LDTRRTLDEEPFAWEQPQDAGIMQPEAVQGFSDGGSVEREEFASGGRPITGVAYERPDVLKIIKNKLKDSVEKKEGFKIVNWSEEKTHPMLIKEFKKNNIKLTNREFINKAITKVFEENNWIDPVQYRREMVVDSFMKHLDTVGEFDGEEKLAKELKPFLGKEATKDKPSKLYETINRDFKDWRAGKFEVSTVDRDLLDKNALKEIKNWMPRTTNIRSVQRKEQLEFLNNLNDKNISLDNAKNQFVKKFSNLNDPLQTFNQRVAQLNVLKLEGKLPSNKDATQFKTYKNIEVGERAPWLKAGLTDLFAGNYSKTIQAADILNAEGKTKEAQRLYTAAEKFFSPNDGIFRKAGGQAEHPFSRKYGGTADQQLKVNSLIEGDLNSFKKTNFDDPVNQAIEKYNISTDEKVKKSLQKEIELRKQFMNYITGSKEFGGIVDPVEFEFTPNEVKVKTNVKPIDRIKNFDVDIFKQRGEAYGETAGEIGKKLGLLTKEGKVVNKKVALNKIENILSKVNKVKEEQSIRIAKSLNKEQSNLICSKLSNGGIPETCLDVAKNDPDRFLKTVASESKNIKAAKDAAKVLTFANIADEALIGGKLGAGILVGINTALAAYDKSEGKDPEVVLNTLTSVIPFLEQGLFGTPEYISLRKAAGTPEGYTNVVLGQQVEEDYTKLKDLDERIKEIKEGNVLMDIEQRPELTEEYMNNLLTQRQEIYSKLSPFLDKEGKIDYTKKGPKDLLEAQTKREQESLKRRQLEEELDILKDYQIKRLGRGLLKPEDKASVGDVKEQIDLGQKKLEEFELGVKQKNFDPSSISYEEFSNIESPDDSMMRQEFKKGGISKRGFLKLLGGTAATGAIAPDLIKALKGGKTATQVASKIKLEPAEGMYPWFPKLVEKIKEMGKPFEEKQLIMEPSYKNDPRPFTSRVPTGEEKLTKHVDGDTTFILREYPDGRIAVDINSPRNQESFGQPVSLYYRPRMEIQNYKGEKKIEPPEFKVLEPEPKLFANGPDDVDITFTEVPKNPKRNIVFGDIEAAERFATGDIKNRKIIPVKQSLRNEMDEDPSTFIMRQSGELGSTARPERIIKLPEEFATGGRVKFSPGGTVKFARMITDILDSLRRKLSFSSHLEKLYGTEKAREQILSPYRIPEGTNKSPHSDILMHIDESRQTLPKEYNDLQNALNEIERDVNNYDYTSADKKGRTLLDKLPESFNFEKLSQDLFPMEDPLNNAFILMDPKRENMRGRYVQKYTIDPKTKRGTIQTFDTFDAENKRWLSEDEWKLEGVESYEKGKEGLN
jgi:hypothetical protein